MKVRFLVLIFAFLTTTLSSQVMASIPLTAAIGGEILQQFKTGKLRINKVVVEQPHIFPEDELAELLAKYEGREITVDELKQIQGTLSKYYFETGYINSGVIIPNQEIENGVVKLKAVHGRLSRVKIKGNTNVSNKYIFAKLKKGINVPLNAQALQTSLGALRQDPLISDVKAHIFPGQELGQSILELEVNEASPYYLNVESNNHQSTSIGQYRLGLNGGHRNLFGMQDNLQADLGFTEGLTDAALNYRLPLNFEDITLAAKINYSQFEVIDPAFKAADIQGSSTIYGVSANYPLFSSVQYDLSASIGLDFKSMTFEILGSEREISDTGDESTPFVLGLDGIIQRSKFAAALSLGLRQGTSLAIDNEDTVTSFTVGSGQLYLAYRPMRRVEWITRVNGQVTNEALPTVEKFAVGGAKSVRGYRENLFVRDNGVVFSTQVKFPVYRSKVFVVPFIDYGRSWTQSEGLASGLAGSGAADILGVGAGVQWNITKRFYSELFWGHAASDVSAVDDLQQDNGFHFLLNYKLY